MVTITEIIPNDLPDWAWDAINKGQLWNTVFKKLADIENNRDYWRREYINEDKKNEAWVEKHLALVRNLLNTETEKSLEGHLFDLYKQFKTQTTRT